MWVYTYINICVWLLIDVSFFIIGSLICSYVDIDRIMASHIWSLFDDQTSLKGRIFEALLRCLKPELLQQTWP